MNTKQILSATELFDKITYEELKNLLHQIHCTLHKEKNILLYRSSIITEKQSNKIYLTCIFHCNTECNESNKIVYNYLKKIFRNNELCCVPYIRSNSLKNGFSTEQISFENFVSTNLELNNILYKPDNIDINKLLKKIYYTYNGIKGKVLWNNYKPINIEKGKYLAKELYCELCLDQIITKSGYKITNDALVFVENDNIYPYYKDKNLVLCVEEIHEKDKLPELLSNKYKLILN
ncbi:MAG: hypothetical protein N3A01_05310 [Bacteroidales bacterium]|nr:hypothetical protein [Bacteroidales bacterium]